MGASWEVYRNLTQQADRCILTAHPEFLDAALTEMKQLDAEFKIIDELAPGVALCTATDVTRVMRRAAEQRPVFVRHLAPVQTEVELTQTEQDIGRLALAIVNLPGFSLLERGQPFAVQSRLLPSKEKRPYTSGQLNQEIAGAIAEETGAVEHVKKPLLVVSILCAEHRGYAGISTARENLSAWPGGARHFAQTPEQISRAEFKLLEALEVFGLILPEGGRALDLGAAPGGWTRLLLDAGLYVVAVDPANLDPRLKGRARLEQYRGYAEDYLEEALKKRRSFDVIANDMRMDARDASRLLVQARRCLRPDGFVISVLKLPHATAELRPEKTLRESVRILERAYDLVQAHQLFHNRQEVTVVAARPRP